MMASTNVAYRRFETMTANINPTTGIRYGVISGRSLDDEVYNDLFYGPQARDLSYEAALDELKAEAKARYEDAEERAGELFESNYGGPPDTPEMLEAFASFCEEHVEKTLRRHHGIPDDLPCDAADNVEDYIDYVESTECDFNIDEPIIEGECDGVKYRISWLGGAPLLWVLEGPLGFANRLCSPCVPNAAELDSGFEPTDLTLDEIHRDHDGYLCYVVPADWLRKED
jgi:hypothetical protein